MIVWYRLVESNILNIFFKYIKYKITYNKHVVSVEGFPVVLFSLILQ